MIARWHCRMWIPRQCSLFDVVVPVEWPRAGAVVAGVAYDSTPLVPLTEVHRWWLWPTPLESDANAGGNRNTASSRAHAGVSLTDAVRAGDSNTPRAFTAGEFVAPAFAEWLMGLPPDWTALT